MRVCAAFSACPTCAESVAESGAVTMSPLFHCPTCTAVRRGVVADPARLGAALLGMRRELSREVSAWVRSSVQHDSMTPVRVAPLCVAQILVLVSQEALVPRACGRLLTFAFGAFRKANMLVQRGRASACGVRAAAQLAHVIASWAKVIPLLIADTSRATVLLEVAAQQVWKQHSAVGMDDMLRHTMCALATACARLAAAVRSRDGRASTMTSQTACFLLNGTKKKGESKATDDDGSIIRWCEGEPK